MEQFSTGSKRDTQEGKPRYDLIPHEFLTALAELYAWGAEHYGDDNWRLGQPPQRVTASMLRHVYALIRGDTDEDHYTRAVFNIIFLWMMDKGYVPNPDDKDVADGYIGTTIEEKVEARVAELLAVGADFTVNHVMSDFPKEYSIVVSDAIATMVREGKLQPHIVNIDGTLTTVYTGA